MIKNKDGSVYKLSRPNPVMFQQDFWDDGSKFILHNFTYNEVILHKEPTKKYQSLDDIKPQDINVLIKETIVPQDQKVKKATPHQH